LFLVTGAKAMDARGVQRLLEKTFGLAETALTVGYKTTETTLRDARLPEPVKARLIPLYGEEALRRTLNYAGLGVALCRVISDEMDDAAAHSQLEYYRVRFEALYANARTALEKEFPDSHSLQV
jgi:hypothetical protein